MWRNWQTRMVQVHVLAREWRFKSSHPHQGASPRQLTSKRPILRAELIGYSAISATITLAEAANTTLMPWDLTIFTSSVEAMPYFLASASTPRMWRTAICPRDFVN